MTSIQQKEFLDFITLLDENGLLPHVVLVGSWAEYLYQHGNVLDGFISAAKTLDIDFLIRKGKRLKNRFPFFFGLCPNCAQNPTRAQGETEEAPKH